MLINGFKKNWFYFVAKSLPYMVSGQNFPTHYHSGRGLLTKATPTFIKSQIFGQIRGYSRPCHIKN